MQRELAAGVVPEAGRAGVAARGPAARSVGIWLLACCAMIFAMVILGGVTRLTHSGLSMVHWRPLTGLLPPLSHAQWEQVFHAYQQFPEFRDVNPHMTVDGFKSIFWLEYVHRIWGRLIGVAFLVPFVWFLIRGRIRRDLAPRLAGIFVLGGVQGAMGWYMVMSGLVDRPDVSQYRLAAHLGLAVVIYGFTLWTALGILWPRRARGGGLARASLGLLGLVFLTMLSGAFVAGLDAGLIYNTFPLMGGHLVPPGLITFEPPVLNIFQNMVTVQFDHRILATLVFLSVVGLWAWSLRRPLPARARIARHVLLAAACLQVTLGISTLLLRVPVPLAAAHQAGALTLFTVTLWLLHEIRRGAMRES